MSTADASLPPAFVTQPLPLATEPLRRRARPAAWWGMVLVVTTEAMIFAGLLSSWFYLRATSDQWPIGGLPRPKLWPIWAYSLVLVGSSIPVHLAHRAVPRGRRRAARVWLAVGFVMGAAFLARTAWDFAHAEFPIDRNAYASIFHTTVGLHALHVLAGLLMSAGVQVKLATGRVDRRRHLSVEMFTLYWHFVDAVWIAVFASLYLSMH